MPQPKHWTNPCPYFFGHTKVCLTNVEESVFIQTNKPEFKEGHWGILRITKFNNFPFFSLFCNNMMSFPAHHLQGHGKTTQLIKFSRQWVRLLSATATSLIYRLCHVMRDRPELTLCSTFYNPARKYRNTDIQKYILQPCTEIHPALLLNCNLQFRVASEWYCRSALSWRR